MLGNGNWEIGQKPLQLLGVTRSQLLGITGNMGRRERLGKGVPDIQGYSGARSPWVLSLFRRPLAIRSFKRVSILDRANEAIDDGQLEHLFANTPFLPVFVIFLSAALASLMTATSASSGDKVVCDIWVVMS